MLSEVFKAVNKSLFIKGMVNSGFKKDSVLKAISKERFSSKMAPTAEKLTSIPAIFWIHPTLYTVKGERRK